MDTHSITLANGLNMPQIGLGTFQGNYSYETDNQKVVDGVKAAIDLGYRHIDTAFIYNTEVPVGQAVSEKIRDGCIKREDIFITTKLWCNQHGYVNVLPALTKSLSSMGLSYIDLFLIHWPCSVKPGDVVKPTDENGAILFEDIDIVNTWKGMEECLAKSLAKSIGVSNFNENQVNKILANCKIKPVVNQVEVHPYHSNEMLVKFCLKHNIQPVAYSPLGKPNRPGKKDSDPDVFSDLAIKTIARTHDKTNAQVVLRFLTQKGLVVVPKSITPSRMRENLQIFDFELTPQEMDTLSSLNQNFRIVLIEWLSGSKEYPFQI